VHGSGGGLGGGGGLGSGGGLGLGGAASVIVAFPGGGGCAKTFDSVTLASLNPLFASAVDRAPPPSDDVSPSFATGAATSTFGVCAFPDASVCCTFSVTLTTMSL
jgi:hypothetical protein